LLFSNTQIGISRRVSSSCTTSDTRHGNSFIAIRISVQSINHVNRMLYRREILKRDDQQFHQYQQIIFHLNSLNNKNDQDIHWWRLKSKSLNQWKCVWQTKSVITFLLKLCFHNNRDQFHHYCLHFLFITIMTSFTITV
jgi:hypothetical protein